MALLSLALALLGLGAVVLLAQNALAYARSPLKTLPGPFLAKFSDIWRFVNHYNQEHIETQQKLHERYGDAVRLGPRTVSLADPDLLKTIYNTRGTFVKSDFYAINDALQNGHVIQNIFSTRSNDFHAQQLKPVQKLYALNRSVELEPLMNDTVRALCSELESRFMENENKGKTCDIADWISYFTWDFLGDMTFSNRMGFMKHGKDIGSVLQTAEDATRYFSVVGQIPVLDKLLGKNPYCPIKFADFAVPAGFCIERFMERMQDFEQYKEKKDFMNSFIEAKNEHPQIVGDNEIIGYLILNILGGADTTAIIMKAVFYHLLKHPSIKSRLVSELHAANLTFPTSQSSLENLPYLDACIKEGFRIHPVVGHILERIVPASGLTLSNGTALPPGTIVGMNPWVIHRNEAIFGANPGEYVPERWLRGEKEADEEFEARVKRMKDADLSFGSGNRTCLGRPLALIELYKVTATLFAKYKIELENPDAEWTLNKQWFVWPHNVKVKMSPY